ncbi:hypothetical protein AMTR_s00014p00091300 [Amborella trichopoda]|uniref:Uncharacterized protein n=1 Tax=Amborella trichopoda TaxID=13333 RepID=W1PPI4_AMBTC|nr:hypothetical protein AMTR_s00014p00091300 [Amborella trichopoda]
MELPKMDYPFQFHAGSIFSLNKCPLNKGPNLDNRRLKAPFIDKGRFDKNRIKHNGESKGDSLQMAGF